MISSTAVTKPTRSPTLNPLQASSAQTLGVIADGKFVVTVQNCGLPKPMRTLVRRPADDPVLGRNARRARRAAQLRRDAGQ